jgi:hypothetical protein
MKFDLQSLATLDIQQATLRMFVTSGSPHVQTLTQVADTNWTENAITYNSRPPKGATITTFIPGSTTNAWREVEITSAVEFGAGSLMSLAIENSGSDGYTFNSDEAASNRLELVVNWGTLPTPTPGPTTTATPGPSEPANPTPHPNGFKGHSYSGATAPTGEKPESKLWFNDGIWWGSLFSTSTGDFYIHRLNWSTQTWSNTGVLIDTRNNADVDALWDGTKLYITSVVPFSTASADRAELRRYSYNASTDTYTLDSGFPVAIVSGVSMETLVMAKDSLGRLWVTYTNMDAVWTAHTTTNDSTWGAPFNLPVTDAGNLSADDISTIVAFDSKIGIMWGNQNTQNYYFATHADNAGDFTWTSGIALGIPQGADDHINLKALSGDPAGRVFAAVKTSLNSSSDPLIMLLVLKPDGTWANHTFSTVAQNQTRPIVTIDQQNRKIYMFAAQPCCSGDVIYYKQASLDSISFAPGSGSSIMDSPDENCINNVSSTKQSLNNASDLVVIAGADCTRFYFHNKIELPQ